MTLWISLYLSLNRFATSLEVAQLFERLTNTLLDLYWFFAHTFLTTLYIYLVLKFGPQC